MSHTETATPRHGIWHIGARDGYLPIAIPSALDSFLEFVMIDGNEGAIGSTVQLADGRISRASCVRVTAVVGERVGTEVWRENACPYSSGLIPIDDRFHGWTVFGNGNVDYVLGEAHETRNTIPVPTTTLDALWSRRGTMNLAGDPSLLVIDAQGASARILRGGEQMLLPRVDAIIAESELIPFYGGTPSLCEIVPWLAERGFWFANLLPEDSPWACPVRRPLGQRSGPLRGSVDAVFIRNLATLPTDDPVRVARYAATCALLGQLDLACGACVQAKKALPMGFAHTLLSAIRASPSIHPPSFAERRSGTVPRLSDDDVRFLENERSPIEDCLRAWGLPALASRVQTERRSQGAKFRNTFVERRRPSQLRELLRKSGVLLAHPVCDGLRLPNVVCAPPDPPDLDDRELIDRIIRAHQAQHQHAPQQDLQDTTTGWNRNGWNDNQRELLAALDAGDTASVGAMLRTMFVQPALTGIAMGSQEYATIQSSADHCALYALQWLDSFAGVCGEIGALPIPNPEVNPTGFIRALDLDPSQAIVELQSITGIPLTFPRVGRPFGCQIGQSIIPRVTLFHYLLAWHVLARPGAWNKGTILEIGGGFGGLAAMLAGRACRSYVGVDLAGACAIQAYFLGRSRPDLHIQLFGEPRTDDASISLLPTWCLTMGSGTDSLRADLVLNQDCLLEMSAADAVNLIRLAGFLQPSEFLSVGPDASGSSPAATGRRMAELFREAGGWRRTDRSPFAPRPGYWREIYVPLR
jgi:hypothetical protein